METPSPDPRRALAAALALDGVQAWAVVVCAGAGATATVRATLPVDGAPVVSLPAEVPAAVADFLHRLIEEHRPALEERLKRDVAVVLAAGGGNR